MAAGQRNKSGDFPPLKGDTISRARYYEEHLLNIGNGLPLDSALYRGYRPEPTEATVILHKTH
jgi:hypothetical protein